MVAAAHTQGPARQVTPADPYAPLLARGISREALSFFSVTLSERYGYPYWRYPVRDAGHAIIGWRYKRAGDDRGRPKYAWGKPSEPDPVWPGRRCPGPCPAAVYNIGALRPAEPAYLVAGEPDTWLFSSLRLPSCSLLAGEGAAEVGAQAVTIAHRQPAQVSVLYDNDETGQRGARTIASALSALGVRVRALALPPDVGNKGDVTDLYRLCGRDRDTLLRMLEDLPELPAPLQQAPLPEQPAAQGSASGSPFERFKQRHRLATVIESAGVPLKAHQAGAYLQGTCPFHHDRSPSLVVWPQRGYWKCYGCGARGDVIDFVERMLRLRGQGQ